MKYIDAEKLKKLIDEKWKELADKNVKVGGGKWDTEISIYLSVLRLIDSLQQEQSEVDFKIEERKWIHDAVDNIFPEDGDFMSEVDFRKILKYTARHFYELGRQAKPEVFDTVAFQKGVQEGRRLEKEDKQ